MNAFRVYQRKEFLLDVYCVKTETVSISQKLAVKKHIERMNITGENVYRRDGFPDCKEQQRHSKFLAKKSTEETIAEYLNQKDQVNAAPPINLENSGKFTESTSTVPEPVYAVVDLRDKYVQRKKRLMAMQGKRWNSYESIFPTVIEQKEPRTEQPSEAIYEDGDVYYSGQIEEKTAFTSAQKSEEENIYEPINIAEQSTSALTLRKYISRLTLNPFLRLHKTSKSDGKDSKSSAHFDLINSSKKSSKFSTMRSRLGVHRKSVQRRIRRLYGTNYEPNPLFQYHHEETPIVLPHDKGIGSIVPAHRALDSPNLNAVSCDATEKCYEPQKGKSKTFDSLPHFKRAVARITLFNTSPFKTTKDTQIKKEAQNIENDSNIT